MGKEAFRRIEPTPAIPDFPARALNRRLPALLAGALACLLPASAAAQAEADAAETTVAAYGAELLARNGMASGSPAKGAAPRAAALDTLELARGRAEALGVLMQWSPGRAIAAAFPRETLDELRARSPQIAPHLEENGSWEGAAAMYVADDVEKRRAIEFHVLETPEGSIEAYGLPRWAWTRNGDRVAVSGVAVGGRVAVREARLLEPAAAQAPASPWVYDSAVNCAATGEQKTAVFLVGRPRERKTLTAEAIRGLVFGEERSLDRYVRTVSAGRAWLSGDVFEVEIDPRTRITTPNADTFEKLAEAAGLTDLGEYNRYAAIGYSLTPSPYIEGISSLGCRTNPYRASYLLANISNRTHGGELQPDIMLDRLSELLIHEYGHSLGLGHSRALLAEGEALEAAPDGMTIFEYGDWYDPMGRGGDGKFFNARQLLGLGWLDPDDVFTVYGEGRYKVRVLDSGSSSDFPAALRIRRRAGTDEWLWVEAISSGSALEPYGFGGVWKPVVGGAEGAFVRVESEALRSLRPESTHLLDFSPGGDQVHNYGLPLWRTWDDPYSSLSLRVESVAADGMIIQVERTSDCVRSVSPGAHAHTWLPQEGFFEVRAPANCAWEAWSLSGWIEIDPARSSGVGPGRVGYRLRRNTGYLRSRSGVVLVGRRSFVAVQNPYPSGLAQVAQLSPAHGSGTAQTFRVVVPAVNKDLAPEVDLTFYDSGRERVCAWRYDPGRSTFGRFRYDWACSLDLSRSQAAFADGKAVIDFHVVFNGNARGRLQVEARTSFRSEGLVPVDTRYGTWLVGGAADNSPPVIERFTALAGGLSSYFSVRASDPDSQSDIADVSLDIRSADETKQCGVAYNLAENRVTLWGASGVRRTTPDGAPIENEYCTVIPSLLDVYQSPRGEALVTSNGGIVFSQAFAGPLTVRVRVLDFGGMTAVENRDFEYAHPGFGPPTLPGFVSPAVGSGDSQRFEWTLLHDGGGENALSGALEFESVSEIGRSCTVSVSGGVVTLERYIYDNDPSTRDRISSDPEAIGSVSFLSPIFLENELCSLNVTGMEDEVEGNVRSLSAVVGFKPAFPGPFTVKVRTTGGAATRGAWHPGNPGGGPWIVKPANTASSSSYVGWFSPGEVVTIIGSGLGPETEVEGGADDYGDLPKELAGTRVLFNDRALPLLSVSASRIEAAAPFTAGAVRDLPRWKVERNGVLSNPVRLLLPRETNPGLFSADGSGAGQALAIHEADGSLNSRRNPAKKSSILTLYATGLGLTDPPAIAGRAVAAGVLPEVRAPVSVTLGGRSAEVLYAGGTPGQIAGLMQVKVRIGAAAPSGAYIPVALTAGEERARMPLTVAIE